MAGDVPLRVGDRVVLTASGRRLARERGVLHRDEQPGEVRQRGYGQVVVVRPWAITGIVLWWPERAWTRVARPAGEPPR
jgi:hypothetical protein